MELKKMQNLLLNERKSKDITATVESIHLNQTSAQVKDYYNKNAELADRIRRRRTSYHRKLEKIIRRVILPGQKVLDLGCGNGDLLNAKTMQINSIIIEKADNKNESIIS